jgi:orotidine-5'-phosphate decarboxylase
MNPKDRIIFALDVPCYAEAHRYVSLLSDHVGFFKVGLELFMAAGPETMRLAPGRVMLDLKLHDVPETVVRAVTQAGNLGARFVTLHVQQRETMERAERVAERMGTQLLAVTVLTSMDNNDLKELGLEPQATQDRVEKLAGFAGACGITGFVASPHDVAALRLQHSEVCLVIPGIRPLGTAAGDQKRTGTPAQAVADGASYIVVGRPIRDAEDPVATAQAIAQEISVTHT